MSSCACTRRAATALETTEYFAPVLGIIDLPGTGQEFLDRAIAAALKPSVGLRNVLTHEYVRVDLTMVAKAVPRAVDGYGHYVREVATALQSRR